MNYSQKGQISLGEQRVEVTFLQPIDEAHLQEIAGSYAQVEKKYQSTYELVASLEQEDIRPAIFRFACEYQQVLIGMKLIVEDNKRNAGASLEEIFRSLTTTEVTPS